MKRHVELARSLSLENELKSTVDHLNLILSWWFTPVFSVAIGRKAQSHEKSSSLLAICSDS